MRITKETVNNISTAKPKKTKNKTQLINKENR